MCMCLYTFLFKFFIYTFLEHFLWFFLFYFIYFILLFLLFWSDACLYSNDRKKSVDLGCRKAGEYLGGVRRWETDIRIHCIKTFNFNVKMTIKGSHFTFIFILFKILLKLKFFPSGSTQLCLIPTPGIWCHLIWRHLLSHILHTHHT